METLTPTQQKLFDWLVSFRHEHEGEISPTIEQMAKAMSRKNAAIQSCLERLHANGYIYWVNKVEGRGRTRIRILNQPDDSFDSSEIIQLQHQSPQSLRIWGAIAAGGLVLPYTDESEFLELSGRFSQSQYYALKVTGDSMIEENILAGDTVIMRIVEEEDQVRNGVIVAALVEGEGTTLKRFKRRGDQITLEAANKNYPDIKITADQLKLLGILVGVWRELGR